MSTSDGAWEMLADALQNSRHLSDQKSLRPQRSQAARDLLRLADRVDYDRTLTMALSGDPHLSADTDEELLSAIDRALERLAAGDMPGFDLATQTAGLLAPLARVDDAAAASYAARLIELQPGHRRMLRELVDAMSGATGPDSLAVLHTLSGLGDPLVRSEAEQALRRREAA
jgi:hypothetical protein